MDRRSYSPGQAEELKETQSFKFWDKYSKSAENSRFIRNLICLQMVSLDRKDIGDTPSEA